MITVVQVQDHLFLEEGMAYLVVVRHLPAVTWPCDDHMSGLSQSNVWVYEFLLHF